MRKILIVVAVTAGLVAGAVPAWAHEEITPKEFAIGAPTFLTLSAANEEQADLVKVTLTAPTGVVFGHTKEPPGWTSTRTRTTITWAGGAVKHDHFEDWRFEVQGVNQPATLTFKVTLGFADGSTHDADAQTTAVAAGLAPTTAAPAPTTAVTTTVGATTSAGRSSGGGETARQRANIALGLGVVAVALSVVALALGARRRKANGASASAGGGDKQDW